MGIAVQGGRAASIIFYFKVFLLYESWKEDHQSVPCQLGTNVRCMAVVFIVRVTDDRSTVGTGDGSRVGEALGRDVRMTMVTNL